MLIDPSLLEEIRAHGEATYPEEGCGFLLGLHRHGENHVTALFPVENRRLQERTRRYLIGPGDYLAADREAARRGLDVVGFYHSHPDAPARPSATDLEEATFPQYTYVIVSILNGHADDLTAWTLAPDRSQYTPEAITRAAPEPPAPTTR